MRSEITKALVTGAGGFIGSHLVERLVGQGLAVRAFLRYNSREDIGNLRFLPSQVLEKVEFYSGDLKDSQSVAKAVQGCDTVFHLAALIGIPYSYRHPRDVAETNIMGTLNVLIAAMEKGVRRLVHTSSSEVYGTARTGRIREDHPLQGQSPYSASKIGADKLVESFAASYKLPAVTIRPFNTFGPRQSMRAVIPTLIAQACFQREIRVGSLKPVRDFTYVTDTVEAFVLGSRAEGAEGKVFNLGTDREVSIEAVLKKVLELTGNGDKKVIVEEERLRPEKSEVMRLRSDSALARAILKWEPRVSLEEGLQKTIDWIRSRPEEYSRAHYVV